jgi:hypothetical protein
MNSFRRTPYFLVATLAVADVLHLCEWQTRNTTSIFHFSLIALWPFDRAHSFSKLRVNKGTHDGRLFCPSPVKEQHSNFYQWRRANRFHTKQWCPARYARFTFQDLKGGFSRDQREHERKGSYLNKSKGVED